MLVFLALVWFICIACKEKDFAIEGKQINKRNTELKKRILPMLFSQRPPGTHLSLKKLGLLLQRGRMHAMGVRKNLLQDLGFSWAILGKV